jgi:hypothetical protein
MSLQAQKIVFIKISSFTNDNLLYGGIIELPPLVALRISYEDTFLHV